MGDNIASLRFLMDAGAVEALSCERMLEPSESAYLEAALHRLKLHSGRPWRWSDRDDRRLKMLIRKRGYSLRIKPFERNDEVQRVARDMGRSYRAVLKRIERLRRTMICPNASNMRKG